MKKQWILIICFLVMTGTPYLLWPLVHSRFDTETYENRELSAFPDPAETGLDDLPEAVEDYIDDHIPFRNQLIRTWYSVDYYLFKTSTSDMVVIGDDGWLFYSNKTGGDGNSIVNYRGQNLLTEEELRRIAENMTATKKNLEQEGCEFILFLAPDRERIYSEFMPRYYGPPAKEYAVTQIVDYLKEHTGIPVVYLENVLLSAKESLGEDALLYHKTDTHWNELGAYIGSRELLKALDMELPFPGNGGTSVMAEPDIPGDMIDMLNMNGMIDPGMTYRVAGYQIHPYKNDVWDFFTEIRYHAEGADPRKLFINRDSFCTAMSDIIGSQFSESVMIHRNEYQNEIVRTEHPDIYVLEVVERNAAQFLQEFRYE